MRSPIAQLNGDMPRRILQGFENSRHGLRVYLMDRVAAGARKGGTPAQRGTIPGTERVLCLNEADGTILWKHEYDCSYDMDYPAGPRATPIVRDGRVYAVGAMGNLFCLNAADGKVIWSHDYKTDYEAKVPMWGFASNPLLDGNKLICVVGGQGSVAVAFDKDTGKEMWKALSAREPGYNPPMIFEAGGKRQLIVWHPEAINSLNPETGETYWSEPFVVKAGLTVPTPRKDGDKLFVTCFYNGPMMLQLSKDKPGATMLWRGSSNSEKNTDKLHSIISTPVIEDGYIYGVCSFGQLRCLREDTGERVWESFDATGTTGDVGGQKDRWRTAFIIKNGKRFFLFNEQGDLIIAHLTPKGYEEVGRAHLLDPTNHNPARGVVWSHPAFANKCIYARNDKEIVCYSLAAGK